MNEVGYEPTDEQLNFIKQECKPDTVAGREFRKRC